jgi:hypothetical protein
MMARHHSVLALLACALLPLSLLGNSVERDAIVDQIDMLAGSNNLSRVSHELYRDWLNEGSHQLVSFELEARVKYHLLGACDTDCSELSFELLRPDGVLLARGTSAGNRTVLSVDATHSGRHQLRVAMRRCSIQPCEWGVRVYRR